jgi:hypothetical protein
MTSGVYLPPVPPDLQLTSILVFRPRCVPDPPGSPPLNIGPLPLVPPNSYPAELLLPSEAPPFAKLPGFRKTCHVPERTGTAIARVWFQGA